LESSQRERAELEDALSARLRSAGAKTAKAGKLGTYFFLGPRLTRSLQNLSDSWRASRRQIPADAVVDASDALVIRIVGRKRLALFLAIAALIPASLSIPFFYRQNELLKEKNEDLAFYSSAQMRARLLEILYKASDEELDSGGRQRASFSPEMRAIAVGSLIPIERERIPKKRAFLTKHIPAFQGVPEAADMFLELVPLYGARLGYAQFEDYDLAGLILGGADLRFCRFLDCDLSGSIARGASVFGSRFERCNLSKAHFDSTLSGAVTLIDCKLTGIDLTAAQMGTSVFRQCKLDDATAIDASFFLVTFDGCSLANSDLSGADFRGADLSTSDLSNAKLRGAYYDQGTRFPAGLSPGDHAMIEGKPPWANDFPGAPQPEPSDTALPAGDGNPEAPCPN
jgi:uncharacterized protein YjbI with pentapeptide repeats